MEFNLNIVWRNLDPLLLGLQTTLYVLAVSAAIAVPVAAIVCAGSLRRKGVLHGLARGFVTVFRTIPEVVLIFWVFYCLPPLTGINFPPVFAGSLALGIVSAAYLAEIFRAGIEAVPPGQFEAARVLGLSRWTTWTGIVIPQATKVALPVTVSYFSELTKGTSLLATIGVTELALQGYVLGAQTFRYFEFLTAIAAAYFIILFPIGLLASRLEAGMRRQA
jgi:His/Glu/Gln/Arg/opine family amino acid ABC transporter permease subunit